ESLPFPDGAFDVVFSFALTKHLPVALQSRVLAEFARVSRRGVISTFGVLDAISRPVWRRRGLVESFPVEREELARMAAGAGLRIEEMRKCTTPIGTERVVRFALR
ncbi:MAG TPA: class I SAM-dependent methyltransferase, partial [Solirubrobacteraceae bacterium]